jgi:hypothetical protein
MSTYESAAFHLFAYNSLTIKSAFKWQNTLSIHLAAMLLASSGNQADAEALLAIRDLIKKNTGMLSDLRGNSNLAIIALLSQTEDPSTMLNHTKQVQALLKASRFSQNDYLAITAVQIALNVPPEQFTDTVAYTCAFYDAMKQNHSLVTGPDDYIFSCLLAMSGLDVKEATEQIEELMVMLKPYFSGVNVRQTLAQVLVLGLTSLDTPFSAKETVRRVIDLREALSAIKLKPSSETSVLLGVLSLLPGEPQSIASQIADCYYALKAEASFGNWQGKQVTLLFAESLVTCAMTTDLKLTTKATLSNAVTNLLIAEQTVLIAASIAAATAAVSSSS